MTAVTFVQRVAIYIQGDKEEQAAFFRFLRHNYKGYTKALNLAYNQLMFEDAILESIKYLDGTFATRINDLEVSIKKIFDSGKRDDNKQLLEIERKRIEKHRAAIKKLNQAKSKEARKLLDEAIGLKQQTRTRDIAKQVDVDLADFVDSANMKAGQDYSNDFIEIKTGKRTSRTYRYKSDKPMIPFRGRDIKIEKVENKYHLSIPKGFQFVVNLGSKPRKAATTASVLEKLRTGEYKLGQSRIGYDGKKLYIDFTITFEKDYENPSLDSSKSLDVRFDQLASGKCYVGERDICDFGDSRYIQEFKTKIKHLKSREQSKAKFAKGGHGHSRKTKHDKWEAIKQREGNFVKTYNNQCTARIVTMALRNKCGIINYFTPSTDTESWAYYQFLEQLSRKAEYHRIVVNVITSK